MIITLYNVNETDTNFYLSKLREIEENADFVSNREGNRPKIKIEATDKDIPSGELKEKLIALGFYIFKQYTTLNPKTGGYIGTIELTLERNLLIVGNGFDIGHGLKTKYSNFLDNINILNEILLRVSSDHRVNLAIKYNDTDIMDENITEAFNNTFDIIFNSLDKTLDAKFKIQEFCTDFSKKGNDINSVTEKLDCDVTDNVNNFKGIYKKISTEDKDLLSLTEKILPNILSDIHDSQYMNKSNIISALTKTNDMKLKWFLAEYFIKENTLLQYFLKKYNDKSIGDKWIDIETELSKIVILAENIIKTLNTGQKYWINNKQLEEYFNTLCVLSKIGDAYTSIPFEKERLQLNIFKLEEELNEFIYLLENYLIHEENKVKSHPKNFNILRDIGDIAPNITHLLSFNYTDTFRQLYDTALNDNVDFIHGKLNEHNLVLGIGETLTEAEENNILLCIRLKKYFQRIFKKTGAKYDDWLIKNEFNTVYIYGHSLDVTDKEILQPVIENAQKVIIFYYNKLAYDQQIINLVKILGKQKFIKYVSKAINKIEFKEQSNLQIPNRK